MDQQATTSPSHASSDHRGGVKPALKHDTHYHEGGAHHDGHGAEDETGKKPKRMTLTWDEHAIEVHDQLRGTRMKIDEPDTPFTHYDHQSDEESASSGGRHHPRSPDEAKNPDSSGELLAANWDDVETKLQAVADRREGRAGSFSSVGSAPSHDSMDCGGGGNGSDDDKKKEMKKLLFQQHRKEHYNEAEAMRRFKNEHADDNEGDDEEM